MIEQLFTKQNLALFGVLALFLWRIIDLLLRQKKRRETELQKLAFDMVKYRFGNDKDPFTAQYVLPHYLFYLHALEHNINVYDRETVKALNAFDEKLTKRIKDLKEVHDKLTAIDEKLINHHHIASSDLWDRNLSWSRWFRETKKLLKRTFSRETADHFEL